MIDSHDSKEMEASLDTPRVDVCKDYQLLRATDSFK